MQIILKAAVAIISIISTNQMTMWQQCNNVEGVAHWLTYRESHHLNLQFPRGLMELYSEFHLAA